jgi:hypothetical protein
LWINVTELMQMGGGAAIQRLFTLPEVQPKLQTYITRLNAIETIKDIDLHIEKVTGEDKTVDIVVDIFNRVNSGGTKLSKGDLALAKICAQWPEARQEMKARLDKWWQAGFHFRLEWLLRNIKGFIQNTCKNRSQRFYGVVTKSGVGCRGSGGASISGPNPTIAP